MSDIDYKHNIANSGKTIYDTLSPKDKGIWIPNKKLEKYLNRELKGIDLAKYPLRTRSKVIKSEICKALGYPVPASFQKTQPRFPGQNFDTYVQKSNNLQIWNESIDANRRYVLIRPNEDGKVDTVKVLTGSALSRLDKTGTLTQKYQASIRPDDERVGLLSTQDTVALKEMIGIPESFSNLDPSDEPAAGLVLPIDVLHNRVSSLEGNSFKDCGGDQERNRGAELHKLIVQAIGYSDYHDKGQFPDICNQLAEVKLQTSPTIDLGLIKPDDKTILGYESKEAEGIRHCDIRYIVVTAKLVEGNICIKKVHTVTGQDFFTHFVQFQGKVINKKIQIPLPRDIFG